MLGDPLGAQNAQAGRQPFGPRAYFNPAITNLRKLVKLPDIPGAHRNLVITHTSLGSFSEASSVFDPEPLRRIFLKLSEQVHALNASTQYCVAHMHA